MKNTFKTLLAFTLLSIFYGIKTFAQGIEITPIVGYTFADNLNFSNGGYGRINAGVTWGGTISKQLNQFSEVEFLYTHEDTKGSYDGYDYYSGEHIYGDNIPLAINYFQLGGSGLKPLGSSGKAVGFAGMDLGAAYFSLNNNYRNSWKFAAGFKLGVKIYPSKRVGINLQTGLQLPIQAAGLGIFAGSGGAGTGVSAFSTITQFSFSGGLILRLGK